MVGFIINLDFTWLPIPSAPILSYLESDGHTCKLYILVFVKKFCVMTQIPPSQLFSFHVKFVSFDLSMQNLLPQSYFMALYAYLSIWLDQKSES